MALTVDQQSNFKHYCKICKKGFGCGRALGGHMRAHGIGDDGTQIDEDDPASDWEDKLGGNAPSNKRMYALRTNPNRFKSCKICENCGKEFLSWKSFLEHGKCSSEDAESLVSSPGSDGDDGTPRRWSKRKRSFRTKVGDFNSNCPSSEEEDLANCLMMLSNATVDPLLPEPEESCASASKDEDRRNQISFVAPISCRLPIDKAKGVTAKGVFECKACKKVFNSHQALGGHRASHKKVKGCFAAWLDHSLDDGLPDDDVITHEEFFPTKSPSTSRFDHGTTITTNPIASSSRRKSKVHECSICHRVFSSGQALGGHKRCHWITSNSPDASSLAKFHHQFHDQNTEQIQEIIPTNFINNCEPLIDLTLDLNLPAPADNPANYGVSTEMYLKSWIGIGPKEKDDTLDHHCDHHHQHDNKINDCEDLTQNNDHAVVDDDEAHSKVKLAKLSELKDMSTSGSSSPWLQVGIGSTTDVGTADP
ncbi:zinc finger protein ZAT9-like [Tripterygium wilfordii]|uniref:zinc finger protein ZAT9-like n=1 Tax=Tripterygium wilfordii TaxID=458696 RepID=UPI0018F80DAE|nr:zinc finger protein ZAT9-like [Tripterygium wilfordii]